jgi:hypothetical protein
VKHPEDVEVACPPRSEIDLPTTFVDYEENPREYFLSSVSTVLDVHTRVSDLYSSPYDQIEEQIRLTIESIKERQEGELINNASAGCWQMPRPNSDSPGVVHPCPTISMS